MSNYGTFVVGNLDFSVDQSSLVQLSRSANEEINTESADLENTEEALSFASLSLEGETFIPTAVESVVASTTTDNKVNALLSGYKWTPTVVNNVPTITYSFYEDDLWRGSYYGDETGVKEVSAAVKANVRSILNWLEGVINIDFQEVVESSTKIGELRYMLSDGPNYAYAYLPVDLRNPLAGDVHLNPADQSTDPWNGFETGPGYHGYMTLIHETLHTLGLDHPLEGSTGISEAENTTANTVMSYNLAGWASPGTAMAYDLAALQHLYGAKAAQTGDTVYKFTDRVDQFLVNGVNALVATSPTRQVLWDSAGVDTLDFSALEANSSGYRFDLRAGGWISSQSDFATDWYDSGVTIAYDVAIENLVNSSSNDTIYANSGANKFAGYTLGRVVGHDVLYGTDGADNLDLMDYTPSSVNRQQVGNDLVLGLGSNGSVTVKDYFLSASRLNILQANNAVVPDVSLGDVSVTEGGVATLTVKLSTATTNSVSLNYTTANGTATAPGDYTTTANSLIFAPGQTEKTISVQTTNDSVFEPTEDFFVNLSNAQNAKIVDNQSKVTILDNDVVALPAITISDVTRLEGSSNIAGSAVTFNFRVSVTGTISQNISVNYSTENGTAIAGSDYISTSGTLKFTPGGVNYGYAAVKVYRDKVAESNETFFVNLNSAVNAEIKDSQAVGTIGNDDAAAIASPYNNLRRTETASISNLFTEISADLPKLGETGQNFGQWGEDTLNYLPLFTGDTYGSGTLVGVNP